VSVDWLESSGAYGGIPSREEIGEVGEVGEIGGRSRS
jgi:hypothetical protein